MSRSTTRYCLNIYVYCEQLCAYGVYTYVWCKCVSAMYVCGAGCVCALCLCCECIPRVLNMYLVCDARVYFACIVRLLTVLYCAFLRARTCMRVCACVRVCVCAYVYHVRCRSVFTSAVLHVGNRIQMHINIHFNNRSLASRDAKHLPINNVSTIRLDVFAYSTVHDHFRHNYLVKRSTE